MNEFIERVTNNYLDLFGCIHIFLMLCLATLLAPVYFYFLIAHLIGLE